MIAILSFESALFGYGLLLAGLFTVVLAYCVIDDRSRVTKTHRLHLRTCEKCGMVFAVERFHKTSHSVACPRCGMEQLPEPLAQKNKGE